MPKTTSTKSKTAAGLKHGPKLTKADKPKREPSAYNLFCKKHLKEWIATHPGCAKEAMSHIALMWKDSPENPNRGKATKPQRKCSPPSGPSSSDPLSSDD